MKASPLLRAWLARLERQDVVIKTRHDWKGWDEQGSLVFAHGDATVRVQPDATILALGGASWPRLGSTGTWAEVLRQRGVKVAPLKPANCGFTVAWSDTFRSRFEGTPLKNIALSFHGETMRGEALITRSGIEGGSVYALSSALRNTLDRTAHATLLVDLRPDLSHADLMAKLSRPRGGESLANFLRKSLALAPVAVNLLREAHGKELHFEAHTLARHIKSAPITLTGTAPIDRAISSAGGIALDAVDDNLMLKAMPNIYAVGEMLDWEAPTGGYLLHATFATAVAAARAISPSPLVGEDASEASG
jgi:hypothetical protein